MLRAILTVDVEEWFHLPTVPACRPAHWPSFASRARPDAERLLEFLGRLNTRATWFTVGALAETLAPALRAAREAGHAIGAHSHDHRLCTEMTPAEFRADCERAARALEAASGARPTLYRAPMWSLHPEMLDHYRALAATGFTRSSSWLPGRGSAGPVGDSGVAEVPIPGPSLGPLPLPWSGTWLMRRAPVKSLLARIAAANATGITPIFWFHSWELDPDPPAVPAGPWIRFVHAHALDKLPGLLKDLTAEVAWQPLA